MTTYSQDEESTEGSHPQEFADIEIGDPAVTAYRITSGERPLVIVGHPLDGTTRIYDPIATEHSKIAVSGVGASRELTFTLPINHPFVSAWIPMPPDRATYTLWRRQETSGDIKKIWSGRIQSINANGKLATFRVPARTVETLLRVIPTTTSGRTCPHVLYDPATCKVSRLASSPDGVAHKVTATVRFIDGDRVQLDTLGSGRITPWARGGELVHVATGARRTIRSQGTLLGHPLLSLQVSIPPMRVGDSVEVYAGCSKLISRCQTQFANRQNFGGFPRMPHGNILRLGNKAVLTGEF